MPSNTAVGWHLVNMHKLNQQENANANFLVE